VEQAAGRIEVLPGGGLKPADVEECVRATGVTQVHFSLTEPTADLSAGGNPDVQFGVNLPTSETEYRATSAELVRDVRGRLDQLVRR
jgi:copper homeostasis protein